MGYSIYDGKIDMIKFFIRSIFIIIFLIFLSVAFLLTPSGLKLSVDLASYFSHGKFTYQKISGVIIGPIELDNIKYITNDKTIFIKKLALNWQPLDLLKYQFYISKLNIDSLHIIDNQPATPITAQNIENILKSCLDFKLPIPIQIDQAHFQQVVFNKIIIPKINFKFVLNAKKWDVLLSGNMEKPQILQWMFHLDGTPEHYHFLLNTIGNNSNLKLNGFGNVKQMTIATEKSKLLNGNIDAHLQLNMMPFAQWTGYLTVTQPDFLVRIKSDGENNASLISNNTLHFKTNSGTINITANYNQQWKMNCDTYFLKNHQHFSTQAKLTGTVKQNNLQIKMNLAGQKISLQLDSRYQNKKWLATFNKLNIIIPQQGAWNLKNPVALTYFKNNFSIQSFCLNSINQDQFCLSGNSNTKFQLHFQLTQFSWIGRLFPKIKVTQGKLIADLNLSTFTANPVISGKIQFQNGAILLPKINITLTKISLNMTSAMHLLKFNAIAYSSNQPITINGQIDLSHLVDFDFPTALQIKTNNALLLNTTEYIAYFTADIHIKISGRNMFITGSVLIPKGTIQPMHLQSTTSLPDNDIIFVGGEFNKKPAQWLIHSDIVIKFGNEINVNTSGVTAHLTGQLHLNGEPNKDVIATGQISVVKGKYAMYGQTLKIDAGSYISYSHSLLSNPILQIRASKVIQIANSFSGADFDQNHLIVGVEMSGPLDALNINFFSTPNNLSQAAILSYLVLGYSTTDNTSGNTDFLLRAISAFGITGQGLMGKENIATKIQQGLGLNELGVESETTVDESGTPLSSQSAFVIGKHLSKRFYIRYSVGLLDPVSVFQLRYIITHHWTAQFDSSSLGNGGDILYTISKN